MVEAPSGSRSSSRSPASPSAPARRRPAPLNLVVGIVAYIAARRVEFRVGAGIAGPTQPVLVVMLLTLPPWVAVIAVVFAALLDRVPDYVSGRMHPDHSLLTLGDAWHVIGPAVVLAAAGSPEASLDLWWLYLLAFAAQVVVDVVVATLREWLGSGVPPDLQLRILGFSVLVDVALAPIGLLAALATPGGVLPLLMLMPLIGLLAVLGREREQRIQHTIELSDAYRGTALLMGELLVADDAYTGGEHTSGVVALALGVGTHIGLDARDQRNLEFGALLHDVGKIRVPDAIINKPGKLTAEEWEIVKRHPADGQEMLDRIGGVLGEVGIIVRGHHERWDGGGYPDGLVGRRSRSPRASSAVGRLQRDDDEPLLPRRDVAAEALEELRACSGTQFDPQVVEAIIEVVGDRGRVPATLRLVA